jgi:hypothetical protein
MTTQLSQQVFEANKFRGGRLIVCTNGTNPAKGGASGAFSATSMSISKNFSVIINSRLAGEGFWVLNNSLTLFLQTVTAGCNFFLAVLGIMTTKTCTKPGVTFLYSRYEGFGKYPRRARVKGRKGEIEP